MAHGTLETDRGPALSKGRRRAGQIVSGVIAALLALDALGKFMKPEAVVKGTLELGFAESTIVPLGVILLASVVLYALPRTSLLGAILLTGYLGGAVATHVRAGNPLFTHTLSPVYVGVLLWVGLTLRDRRLEALLFARSG
jgi:hypothetical protein